MFTPTEQNIPGNTPPMDLLQMQFMTNGQMQYMPQAQFMTPSSYGAFRTMPAPEAYTAPTDGGYLHNLNVANRGRFLFGWTPEYTINTFNPAVSQHQQQLYARRRVADAENVALAGAAGVLGEASIGALGMAVPQLALPAMALSMAGLDLSKPVKERLRTTREIQDISTRKIFGGTDVDQSLGYGFSDRAARSIDKYIRKEAADDRIFDKGDWQELLKLGTQFGQFDYANNAEQYKRILKNMRNSMSVMMEVLGSSDFKDVMENMKRMRDMGATMERYNQIAIEEQAYSRNLGLSHQEAINTYGKTGAVVYQQRGLNAMQGSLQNMANAANLTYMQRTGVLDPTTVAQFGGISGMAQEMTEQGATAHTKLKDLILPALMNDDMTGLRTDIDFEKVLTQPGSFNRLQLEAAGRLSSKERFAEFQANKDRAYAQYQNKIGTEGQEKVEMHLATEIGRQQGFKGHLATRRGLEALGYSPEIAHAKYEAYYNEENKHARRKAEEEAAMQRREEDKAKYTGLGAFLRLFKGAKNELGEGIFDMFTGGRFNTGAGSKLTQEEKDARQTASGAIDRGDATTPTYTPNTQPYTGSVLPDNLPKMSDSDILRVKNEYAEKMSDEEGIAYFNSSRALIKSETGKDWGDDVQKSQEYIDQTSGALGGFQVTLARLAGTDGTSILDTKFMQGYREKYFGDVNWDIVKNAINKYGGTSLNLAKLKKGDPAAWEEIQKIFKGWREGAKDRGFNAGVASSIRYDIVHDRLNDPSLNAGKKGEMMSLLRGNLSTMKALESAANLGGTGVFKKAMNQVFAKYQTPEALQKELSKNNGYGVVKDIFDIVDKAYTTVSKDGKVHNPGGQRYKTGSLDDPKNELLALMQEMEGRTQNKDAAQVEGFSALAENVLIDPDEGYIQGYNHNLKQNAKGKMVRPDCSGYATDVVKRYAKETRGTLTDDMREVVESSSPTAAGMYNAHMSATGGKADYSVDKNADGWEAAVDNILKNAKEGDVLYFGGDNDKANRTPGKEGIGHVGFVVKKNGELFLAHRGGTNGLVLKPLKEALSWSGKINGKTTKGLMGYNTVFGFSLNSAFKDKGNRIPSNSRAQGPLGGDQKALEEVVQEAERRASQYDTPYSSDGQALGGQDLRNANSWIQAEIRGALGDERLIQDLGKESGLGEGLTGAVLDQALTVDTLGRDRYGRLKGTHRSTLSNLFSSLTGDGWKQFADYKGKGKEQWGELVYSIVKRSNPEISDEDAWKKVDELMANEPFMQTLQATVLKRYHHTDKEGNLEQGRDVINGVDYGDLIHGARIHADPYIGKVTSRNTDKKNENHNNLLLGNALDNGLGIHSRKIDYMNEDGEMDIYYDFYETPIDLKDRNNLAAYANAREAMATAMSKQTVVKGTGIKEGAYYEQTSNIMNLFQEYTYGNHSAEDKKKLRERLESLAKSAKISPSDLKKLLDKGGKASDFATAFFKKAGLKSVDDEAVQKLIKNSGILVEAKKTKDVAVNSLLGHTSDTIGKTTSDREMLINQMQEAFLRLKEYTGSDYTAFHDKSKVSDTQAQQAIDLFRQNGYNSVAQLLESARKNGTAIDPIMLTRAVNQANAGNLNGGVNGTPFKPGQKGNDTGNGSAATSGVPNGSVSGGVGPVGSGIWDDPQVKSSMLQIAPNLEENTKTLREVRTLLERNNSQPLNGGSRNN